MSIAEYMRGGGADRPAAPAGSGPVENTADCATAAQKAAQERAIARTENVAFRAWSEVLVSRLESWL